LAVVNKGVHNNESLVTMGILTDLGYEEACNVLNRESISSDEILDLYESCNK
jgi:hypothetical protein